ENVPAVQDEIRRWQAEREELEAELRKRPPTEQDVNDEAMEVLRCLYWLGIFFRIAADPMDPEEASAAGGATLEPNFKVALRPYLRHVSAITVHTEKREGRPGVKKVAKLENGKVVKKRVATGTRHVFLRGEIAFIGVGGVREKLNHHPLGVS